MTTTEPTTARPTGFSITVPEHWARFDLSDAPFAKARQQALKTARTPVDRIQVDDLFRQARAINRAARRRGALWGAGTATAYSDALFLGHVMVFGIDPGDDVDMSLPTLTKQLSRDGVGPGTAESASQPREVKPVTLSHVGEAVRIMGIERASVSADATVEMLSMHTLVKVPGGSTDQFLITCCSPNVALAEQVYELFDAVSDTFRFS
ncbi:hypothetical protein QQY24_06410 [Streptomyces sp. TG1A-8]|uniref:hypothetical protein n=1 Tax=Streptomyces sp. TG1A-8 TaxID=3051385 RepID=UPI00265B793E|nr:hypothetical protein [Streptomyces sp. TG1A-8]MDO0925068.1 hypothetical protein [Streptomyces sp. TG1A-8]